jgi:hypothetical protein
MTPFAKSVELELARARRKHVEPMHSAHEAHSVIEEEYEEFKQEVFKQHKDRSKSKMLAELVQLAAMCQRAAEDLNLFDV